MILGIETSCDETAVAVVEDGRRIRSNVIGTQLAHQATGGIVPEVAAREHLRSIDPITDQALRDAGITLREVDAVELGTKDGQAWPQAERERPRWRS